MNKGSLLGILGSLTAILVSLLMPCSALAAGPAGFNYDETKVGDYTLPDLFRSADGTRITTVRQWEKMRRPEVLRLFETYQFGRMPEGLPRPKFEVLESDSNALNGTAVRKQVAIWLAGTNGGPRMDLLIYLPKSKKRVPMLVGLNFGGNHAQTHDPGVFISHALMRASSQKGEGKTVDENPRGMQASRWPIEMIVSNGVGVATAYYGDLEPDYPEGWKKGVRGHFARDGERHVFGAEEWGAIGAWAWGLSKAMDYFESDRQIDSKKVAVIGHSRLGKTALWAGATDTRFAVIISNESGEGGAALSRRTFGETVERINTSFPHWFCGKYKEYNKRVPELPVDAHMLIALAAPRPVYVASAQDDQWADPHGEFLAAKNAEPVYSLYGRKGIGADKMPEVNTPVAGTLGYHMRSGPHDITSYDWAQYLAFASTHWQTSRAK